MVYESHPDQAGVGGVADTNSVEHTYDSRMDEATHPLQYALVGSGPARYVHETGAMTNNEIPAAAKASDVASVHRYNWCTTCREASPCRQRRDSLDG